MNNRYLYSSNIPLTVAFPVSVLLMSQAYAVTNSADWDNDGLSDQTEILIGTEMYLADTDGDGINDKKEVGDISKPKDTDKDGRIDALDVDDDNDGIPTVIEGAADPDHDGIPSYLDIDSDGDGLDDRFEVQLTGKDSNHDGVDDLFDADTSRRRDANGDGIVDSIILKDSNQNGVPDLFDNKSRTSHGVKGAMGSKGIETKRANGLPKKTVNHSVPKKVESNPVVVSAAQLPPQVVNPVSKPRSSHKYLLNNKKAATQQKTYGGSGYFYCANNGRIVKGIKGFAMTPPSKVTLLRDASNGEYQWRADGPGTYALQFQIPKGMSIVRGLSRGRRIVKAGDINPLILGAAVKKGNGGFLNMKDGKASPWYTSFDLKDNAPLVANNNIPLSGDVCGK